MEMFSFCIKVWILRAFFAYSFNGQLLMTGKGQKKKNEFRNRNGIKKWHSVRYVMGEWNWKREQSNSIIENVTLLRKIYSGENKLSNILHTHTHTHNFLLFSPSSWQLSNNIQFLFNRNIHLHPFWKQKNKK